MTNSPPRCGENVWPASGNERIVFLVDAVGPLERRLAQQSIESSRPPHADTQSFEMIPIPSSRGGRRRRRMWTHPRLEACVASDEDAVLAPIRVVWLPTEKDGQRTARFSDLLLFDDPRDPVWLRKEWVLWRHPDRCRVVVGEPATVAQLRTRWRKKTADATESTSLSSFIIRQASLALERSERQLRGARYKVPRFIHEEILSQPQYRGGVSKLAREQGRPEKSISRRAEHYLHEIAATHSPFVIDLVHRAIGLVYRSGYGKVLHYDRSGFEEIYELGQRYPLVFLPAHKSNLDHPIMQYLLYENGHPPNHTAGGINMNFFPVGPLFRRSGVFFIRRTFKDNLVYKFVLQQYVDYLIEKRFCLEWYLEGGRSRSGKLLPPRFGLLARVVDAFRRGKSDDVFLIPVSIAYDQIQDVGDYAAEQRGGIKQRESFSWFIRLLRTLRQDYGDIHISFGEPLSLRKMLGAAGSTASTTAAERELELQKIAFEVCVRINQVTPITPTCLVTLALLGTGARASTLEETVTQVQALLGYVHQRKLATTRGFALDTTERVRRVLSALVDHGVVECFAEGPQPVYRIGPGQHLQAAFYRNTVVHFFVNAAIAELALVRVGERDVQDPMREFWDEAMRLRDLLKFEFFFADKEAFRQELHREVSLHDAQWPQRLAGVGETSDLLRRFRPFVAHRVLRTFVEAYLIVGDALQRSDPGARFDQDDFVKKCLALGRQYHLQQRIRSAESVSKALFATALRLADNRALLAADLPDLRERRRAFAEQIRQLNRRIDAIESLAASRRAGLID